jgi:hypothetical protein
MNTIDKQIQKLESFMFIHCDKVDPEVEKDYFNTLEVLVDEINQLRGQVKRSKKEHR